MTRVTKERADVRFVLVKGVRYLRADDVATYLAGIAATEETDVRNRLNEVVRNLGGGA